MDINSYKQRKLETLNEISNKEFKHISEYTCSPLCRKCLGSCCLECPCGFSPKDFVEINNFSYMKSVLDTGFLAIAPLNIKEDVYYIRARGENDLDTVVTGFQCRTNSCIFETTKGCALNPMFRPSEGLLLTPCNVRYGIGVCDQLYSGDKILNDWKEYQEILLKLKKHYKTKEIDKPKINSQNIKLFETKILKLKQK